MALTFTNISSPVGIRNGQTTMLNAPADLAIVTDLFDRIPMANGGSAELFGVWSNDRTDLIQEVADQIVTFQSKNQMAVTDGVIDPGGGTIKLMNKLAADRLLTAVPGDPAWEDWGFTALPQLSHNKVPEITWELTFNPPGAPRAMNTRAYKCDKALGTPHIGIGWPTGVTKPSAYLIYFHHSLGQQAADYASGEARFKKGIGDYLIGRMKGMEQIAWSGKDVCLVVPEPTFAGQGIFDNNEKLITEALKEIDADLTGGETRDLPPLLVASYSDGLGRLNNFMNSCPSLRKTVRGIYDFDGLYVGRFAGITMSNWSNAGATVYRYVGNSSPGFAFRNENKLAYLMRCISQSPSVVPLPKARWVNHPHYLEFTTNAVWAAQWWMHFYIPSCMLFHGLTNTNGI
jgi:hypothetical protein